MPGEVPSQAESFAEELTDLFAEVLPFGVPPFIVQDVRPDKVGRLQIGPKLDTTLSRVNDQLFSHIPLREKDEAQGSECLSLKVLYTVDIDEDGDYLRVLRSTMGLWLDASPGDAVGKARPVFRIEFERNKRSGPPAHIHFHAESAELAWLYGRAGRPMVSVSDVHFPVGGRRFRPTIEDVLRFLDDEGIYTNWAPTWERRLNESLERWHVRQAAAAARRYPEAAAEALRKEGYIVTGPDSV